MSARELTIRDINTFRIKYHENYHFDVEKLIERACEEFYGKPNWNNEGYVNCRQEFLKYVEKSLKLIRENGKELSDKYCVVFDTEASAHSYVKVFSLMVFLENLEEYGPFRIKFRFKRSENKEIFDTYVWNIFRMFYYEIPELMGIETEEI